MLSSLYNEGESSEKALPHKRKICKSRLCFKKPPIKPATQLQRVFHKVNTKVGSRYFTKNKVEVSHDHDTVAREPPPFVVPEKLNQFSFRIVEKMIRTERQNAEMKRKYSEKTNVRSRKMEDCLERLFMEEPDPIKIKTILDIDPDFYTIVEGRPVGKPFSMSKYLQQIRDVLRTRLMVGFRNDELLLFEEKIKREQKSIDNIKKNYAMYLQSFEQFLSEDYNESMKMLRTGEQASLITMEKSEKIKCLHRENAALEFNVHKLEERWRDLKMYQKFLYFISPMSWRQKYDYIHRSNLDNEPSTIFQNFGLGEQGQAVSLTNLVDAYLEGLQDEEEPALYFTSADELIKVFRFIEIQNLNCLLHTEEIQVPMENMNKTMEEARKNFEKEAKNIQGMIDQLSGGIEWEEGCTNELKDMAMKHIEGIFRKLVSDDDVLKLHVFVEDVYESTIGKNDSELTIFDMMAQIEQAYNNLVLQLDGLPQHIVKTAEKYRFAEQNRLAKLCEETTQKIALVDSITWRLKKSLEPPYVKKRELVWRSAPFDKPVKPPSPPRHLTEKEKEYLAFFTVYCAHTDNVEDYGIDLAVPESDITAVFGHEGDESLSF